MVSLNPSDGIAVFTDGSANSGDRSGGWAWVALDAHGNMAADAGKQNDTTVNQMELYAPTRALQAVHEAHGSSNVLVYSDSLYVVLGCNDRSRARRKNRNWWDELDEAIALHKYVEWNHVRGHSDNLYNGLADEMAKEARKNGTSDRRRTSRSDRRPKLRYFNAPVRRTQFNRY